MSPQNPLSELLQAAIQGHEMYRTLMESGFTKQEALYLVGQILTGGGKLPPENLS